MLDKILSFIADLLKSLPVENGGTGASNAEQALKNLGGVSIKKVWNRPTGLTEFTAQTVATNTDAMFYIIVFESTINGDTNNFVFIEKNKVAYLQTFSKADTNEIIESRTRRVESTSNGSFKFGSSYSKSITNTTNYMNNLHCAPLKIFAVSNMS